MRSFLATSVMAVALSIGSVASPEEEAKALRADEAWTGAGGKWINKIYDLKNSIPSLAMIRLEQAADNAVFLADNVTLLVQSHAGRITLWDTISGKVIRDLAEVPVNVLTFAVSPDRRFVAVLGKGGDVIVWELPGGRKRNAFKWAHSNAFAELEFSSDAELLAVRGGNEGTGRRTVWDLRTGKEIWNLDNVTVDKNGRPTPVDWDLSLKFAAIGHEDKSIELVDLATGRTRQTLRGHRQPIDIVLVDRQGKSVLSAATAETARVWDIQSGRERSQVNVVGRLVQLGIKRNGTPVVTVHKDPNSFVNEDIPIGDAAGIRVVPLEPFTRDWLGASLRRTSGYGYVEGDAVTRDGRKGCVCMGLGPCLGGALFIEAGKDSRVLIAGQIPGHPVSRFSPDDRWLVAAVSGESPTGETAPHDTATSIWLGVWDASAGKPLFRLKPEDGVGEFTFSPDGRSLAVVGSKRIYLWRDFAKDAAAASK